MTAGDGTPLVVSDRSIGEGPLIVFAHATGFCKEVWDPVLDDLAALDHGWSAVAIDQRYHGESGGGVDFDWWLLGHDLLSVLGDRTGVIGVGHSGGGVAIAMAEVLHPGTFAAMLLIEPVIFPPSHDGGEAEALARAAERRRSVFPNRQAVLDSYRGRGSFARWDDRALDAYVAGGFVADGSGVRLRCEPAAEAGFFRHAGGHDMWERMEEIGVPVSLVAGADSDSPAAALASAHADRLVGSKLEVVAAATHFVPMERPGLMARRVKGLIESARSEKQPDTE